MTERDARQTYQEYLRFNSFVKAGINAREKYFLKDAEMYDDQWVELGMNKGDLQAFQVLNAFFVNSAYGHGKYEEGVLPSFDISKKQWDNFADNQAFARMELERTMNSSLFKVNPPIKPEDWEKFNETETGIKVRFKTARTMIQAMVGAMGLEDLESANLKVDKDRKKYYEHAIIKDKRLGCARGLLSQLAEKGFPVAKSEIPSLDLRIKMNKPDVEMAKILSEEKLI